MMATLRRKLKRGDSIRTDGPSVIRVIRNGEKVVDVEIIAAPDVSVSQHGLDGNGDRGQTGPRTDQFR